MTFDPSGQPGAFAAGQPVSADQLRELRAEVWGDGGISAAEAEKLFEINRTVAPSKDWSDFFLDALSAFMLSQHEPRGYITEDDANWLISQMAITGYVQTPLEIELIVKLLEHAQYAPGSLRRFALGTMENVVMAADGKVDDSLVALIRRLIFAPASDGPAKVSEAEAEMLFRLKDRSLGKDNSPEWKKLFVQGIANHLMAHQSYVPPSAEEELRLEAPYEARPFGHVLPRLGDMRDGLAFTRLELEHDFDLPWHSRPRKFAGLSEREMLDAMLTPKTGETITRLDREVGEAADAEVTGQESHWLQSLFDQDGQHDEYEQALLDFLAEDGVRPF